MMQTRLTLRNIALGYATACSLLCASAQAINTPSTENTPGMLETQAILARLHLTPDLLSASGMTQGESSVVFTTTYTEISERWENYSLAQSMLNTLLTQKNAITQQLKAVDLDSSVRAQLGETLADVKLLITSHESTLNSLRNEIDVAALASMSSEDRTRFVQIRSNKAYSVPIEYRVLELEESDWLDLRHAFAVIKTNENPSSEWVQIVSGYDAMFEVNLAKVNFDTHFTAVNSAFTNFLIGLDVE